MQFYRYYVIILTWPEAIRGQVPMRVSAGYWVWTGACARMAMYHIWWESGRYAVRYTANQSLITGILRVFSRIQY